MNAEKRNTFHQAVYGVGFLGLAFSLTFSPFGVSLCQFILGTNWLLEGRYKQKWHQLRSRPEAFFLIAVVGIYILGLLHSDNLSQGLHEIKIKLPFLSLAVLFFSIPLLKWYSFRNVMISFLAGTLVSSLLNITIEWGYFEWVIYNRHSYSYIISHIRYSLYLVMAIVYLGYSLIIEKSNFSPLQWLTTAIFLLWFIFYLLLLKAFTGILLFSFVLSILLGYKIVHARRVRLKVLMLTGLTIFVFLGGYLVYDAFVTYSKVEKVDYRTLPVSTFNGVPYQHDTINQSHENGRFVFLYVCPKELEKEWPKRSGYVLQGLDNREQSIYTTLLRYLTSKGLTKDSAGLADLTDKDIRNIENGHANYLYANLLNPKGRLVEIFWEIDHYFFLKGNPNNHSVTQRVEFARAAWHIVKQHPWFGVGTGDWPEAYRQAYEEISSPLSQENWLKAHNQYLTFLVLFGMVGTAVLLLLLVAPVAWRANRGNFLYLMTLFITLVSFFNEDMLDTQAGCTFVVFFMGLLLNNKSKKQNK